MEVVRVQGERADWYVLFQLCSRNEIYDGVCLVDLLHIHRQSAYLIGRDRFVADITIDHRQVSVQSSEKWVLARH